MQELNLMKNKKKIKLIKNKKVDIVVGIVIPYFQDKIFKNEKF